MQGTTVAVICSVTSIVSAVLGFLLSYFTFQRNKKKDDKELYLPGHATSKQGMKTEQIAQKINYQTLFERWDKEPVSEKRIWTVVLSDPETFVKSDGRIRLMI